MFFKKKKCGRCEVLEAETKYLRSLVDRFLEKNDMKPVHPEGTLAERIEADVRSEEQPDAVGVETYGV